MAKQVDDRPLIETTLGEAINHPDVLRITANLGVVATAEHGLRGVPLIYLLLAFTRAVQASVDAVLAEILTAADAAHVESMRHALRELFTSVLVDYTTQLDVTQIQKLADALWRASQVPQSDQTH